VLVEKKLEPSPRPVRGQEEAEMPAELPLTTRLNILLPSLILWVAHYFVINRLGGRNRPRTDWSMRLDAAIPFIPQSAIVYLSTYPFGLSPFILISEARLFTAAAYGYLIITAVSAIINVIFPSQVRRVEDLNPDGISSILLGRYQRLCRPYDNFPSTHVAYSVVVVGTAYLAWGPDTGSVFLLWAFLIAISTMTTKQHYLADVASGGALGLGVFLLVMRFT
jgi:membrane-associated phospholipid phosphatase